MGNSGEVKALIDACIESYVDWREACTAERDAYARRSSSDTLAAGTAFGAYREALDREEAAAERFARVSREVCALAAVLA